jgi:hypothetical protein
MGCFHWTTTRNVYTVHVLIRHCTALIPARIIVCSPDRMHGTYLHACMYISSYCAFCPLEMNGRTLSPVKVTEYTADVRTSDVRSSSVALREATLGMYCSPLFSKLRGNDLFCEKSIDLLIIINISTNSIYFFCGEVQIVLKSNKNYK